MRSRLPSAAAARPPPPAAAAAVRRSAGPLSLLDRFVPATKPGFGRTLVAIAAVAFFLRLAVRLSRGATDFWTAGYVHYAVLAHSLAHGQGYALPGIGPTAFRVPGYPLFLALTGGGEGAFVSSAIAASLVSTGTVVLTALLATHRSGNRAGLVAGAMAALYPYFVVHDTALQESGLFAYLTAAATLMLWRLPKAPGIMRAALSGLVLGLALLTRATLLPFVLLALIWVGCMAGERMPGRLRSAAIVALAAALVLAPWLAWSYHVTGRVALGTEAGSSLWGGNNAYTFTTYPERSIDLANGAAWQALPQAKRASLLAMGEAERSDALLAMGADFIRAHPGETAIGAARKLGAAFGPWPSPRKGTAGNWLYLSSFVPILLLGIAGAWRARRGWRSDALIYAHFVGFAVPTMLFWAHTSHRAYLDVYLIVFAAGLLAGDARAQALPRAR